MRGFELGGDQELRAFLEIFRGVVVEFAVRDDFAGDRRLRIVIAEDGDFDFAGGNGFLDQNLHCELASQVQRRGELLARVDFAHTHRRTERGWLYKYGVTEFQFDGALSCFRASLPIVAIDGNPRHDGDFRDLKQTLGDILVHADGRAEDTGAHEGQSSEIEQALNRSVFAERAVHHGEDDVNSLAPAAPVQLHKGGVSGIGGHHDALAALQDFRQHFLRAGADEPVALFGDADGHGFILVGVQAANYRSGGGQGDFMLAGPSAE